MEEQKRKTLYHLYTLLQDMGGILVYILAILALVEFLLGNYIKSIISILLIIALRITKGK